jgi:hypothetical protein
VRALLHHDQLAYPDARRLKRRESLPIMVDVSVPTPYVIPSTPPPELLAELDAAARALDALSERAAELTLAMDEEANGMRIELHDDRGARPLSPTELFAFLTGT